MTKKVSIYPLDVGTLEWDQSEQTYRRGIGKRIKQPFMAWYIEGLEKKVLVDTGPPPEDHAQKYHSSLNPRISKDQEMVNALKKIGINPQDIDMVILTHLHWDHTGNLDKFPNAEMIAAEVDMTYAMNPLPPSYAGYEAFQIGLQPFFIKVMKQIRFISMEEQEILPRVSVLPTPGHTPGSLSVLVETAKGPYILASDAIYTYENLSGDLKNQQKYLPPGIFIDLRATWESMELIHKRAGYDIGRIIPGHDYKVLEKKSYP